MKGKQSILLSQIEQFSQMVLVGTNQYVLLLIQYIQINLKKKSFSGQDLIKFLEMIIPCCWCTCPVYSSTHELCVHFQTPQILLFPTCPPGALSLSQHLPLTDSAAPSTPVCRVLNHLTSTNFLLTVTECTDLLSVCDLSPDFLLD